MSTPSVALEPYLSEIISTVHVWLQHLCRSSFFKVKVKLKWSHGVDATHAKLRSNMCDFCFKLPEKVHRCCKKA